MGVSQFACSISGSPTMALNEQARVLREQGESIVHLGIGEPQNKAPQAAIDTAAAALSAGKIKYTPTTGIPSFKKAVIKYTEENYGRTVSPKNVIVCSGAKQAIFNALWAILDPGDEVILLAPYWVSYPEIVKMVSAVPVVVRPEDGSFIPRFEEIERAVSSATKAIIVNSPNNPSGAIYPEALVSKIVELCERKGIWLILDDIYHKLVFDGKVAVPGTRYTDRDIESTRLILVNGVAKLYGMTGFRVGWVVAPRNLVEIMTNVQAQTTSCVSPVLQAAAEGALTGMQSVVEGLRLTIQNNRDVLMTEMRTFSGVKITKPEGTFYSLPDFRAYMGESVALSRLLLEKARVVTVPGREFGMEGHLRVSFAGSVKDIVEGVARMKWALDPSSPNEIYIGDRKMVRDWL